MYIKELTQNFTTKKEAFKALKEAKDIIVSEAKKEQNIKELSMKAGGMPIAVKPFKPN